MKYGYLREMPPRERPRMLGDWGGEHFRDKRKLGWFAVASLPSLVVAVWRGLVHSDWALAALCLVICQALVFLGFVSLCSGMTSSNWGTYFRDKEPIRFWLDVSFLLLAYLLGMAAMWPGR